MAKLTQIEASKLPPLSERLDNLDKQEEEAENALKSCPEPIDAQTLASLEGSTKADLIALVRRIYGAGWGFCGLTGKDLIAFASKSKGEIYEALKLRAVVLAYAAEDAKVFRELASFWADREIGKAAQTIQMNVQHDMTPEAKAAWQDLQKVSSDALMQISSILDAEGVTEAVYEEVKQDRLLGIIP